jgi:predicted outer membrane repeat protein
MRTIASASLTNVLFIGNTAGEKGGGMYVGTLPGGSGVTLTNATFGGNWAGDHGGGIYNLVISSPDAMTLDNVIMWGDASPDGPEIFNELYGSPMISYSLIEGCGGSGAGWDASVGTDGGNNIDNDPLFADAAGGNFRLTFGSPAIDAGDSTVTGLPEIDLDGEVRIRGETVDMGPYEFCGPLCPMEDSVAAFIPQAMVLKGAYPNPFNPMTMIRYDLREPSRVSLLIYNLAGRLVKSLRQGVMEGAGCYEVAWNGTNDAGSSVASGTYFCRLTAGDCVETRRMCLIR